MKILVLGASGMLGHKLCQELPKYGHDVWGTLRRPLDPEASRLLFGDARLLEGVDASSPSTMERAVLESGADLVVNAVGLIKQRKEAARRSRLSLLNAYLPHFLADVVGRLGKRLVHISTDCVFDGRRGDYRESDSPSPEDAYGQSKLLGETEPEEPRALTLRTSMVGREIGPGAHGLLEWFFSARGGPAKGFARAIYTGLTTIEAARAVHFAAERGASLSGTVHVSSAKISKFDLLSMVNRRFGLGVSLERADGPCDRSLVMDAFPKATGYEPPSWEEMVAGLAADPTPYDRIRARTSR